MRGKSFIVVTASEALWRELGGPLAAAGGAGRWIHPDEPGRAAEAVAADLALVDPATVAPDLVVALQARCGAVVAVASGAVAPALERWLDSGAGSLVARLGPDDAALGPDDLVGVAARLVGHDAFGLEQHLTGFAAAIESRVVTRADEREAVLEAVGALAARLGLGSRRGREIRDVADELITNAVYDAPRGADGVARHAHRDRRDKLTLDPTEYVTVRFGSDGQRFGLSVTDGFGALGATRLASCLRRGAGGGDQIEHKAGGAGLGLYLALRYAEHLAVTVRPARRTEVTALWRLGRRPSSAAGTLSYLVVGDPDRRQVAAVAPSERSFEVARWLVDGGPAAAGHDRSGGIELAWYEESSWPELRVEHELDTLAELRGVHLLRQAEPPGLDTTVARLRGAAQPSQVLTAATAFLIGSWQAAVLFEVGEHEVAVVCAAGDVDDAATLTRFQIARASDAALAALVRERGLMTGPLTPGSVEAEVARLAVGPGRAQALALALPVGDDVRYVLFACRPTAGVVDLTDARTLMRELVLALGRTEPDGPGSGWPGDSAIH